MHRAFRLTLAMTALFSALPAIAAAEITYPDIFRADAFRNAVEYDGTFRPVTHHIDLRFGMTYHSDGGWEPGYAARYTLTLNHQFDNGWQVGVSLGMSLDNLNTPAPWRDRGTGRF